MKIIFILVIISILVIDYSKVKSTKKMGYIYLTLSLLAISIYIIDQYELVTVSPLEVWLEKMSPFTNWIETSFK